MKIKTRVVQLKKGLSRRKAFFSVPRWCGDFRGFKYDPKTGRALIT